MNDLLQCPFCGGNAELREGETCDDTWLVRCTVCQCKTVTYYTKAQAIGIWNNRIVPHVLREGLALTQAQRDGAT